MTTDDFLESARDPLLDPNLPIRTDPKKPPKVSANPMAPDAARLASEADYLAALKACQAELPPSTYLTQAELAAPAPEFSMDGGGMAGKYHYEIAMIEKRDKHIADTRELKVQAMETIYRERLGLRALTLLHAMNRRRTG